MYERSRSYAKNKRDIINRHFNEYYICNKEIDISDLVLQQEEVSDTKWFEKEDILNRISNQYDGITDKTGVWEYLKRYYQWKEKIVKIEKNNKY